MQLAETFRTPSSNQRMRKSSLLKETSLIRVGGVIQSRRLACSAQKTSGVSRAAIRAASYASRSMWAFSAQSAGTG